MVLVVFALLASAALLPAVPPASQVNRSLQPSTCVIAPDKTVPVRPAPGRAVYCGLDIGSRTVKLSVDSRTGTAGPLPPAGIADLVGTIREYQDICRLDHGTLVSAGATQWARDATNTADVQARVRAATGLAFDVLSPAQEAEFGYIAASVDTPGRIVLDPGSNSFEIAWQGRRGGRIRSVVVEYGYVRGAANDFEPAPSYAAGVAAYQTKVRANVTGALARLSPPMDLAALARLVRTGQIGRELIGRGRAEYGPFLLTLRAVGLTCGVTHVLVESLAAFLGGDR